MKTRIRHQGFAFMELILIVAIVAIIGLLGYAAYNAFNKNGSSTTANTTTPTETTANVPAAPTINSASGLDQATAALNQTDPNASSADSAQLDTQMNF